MAGKPDPNKVHGILARLALERAKSVNAAYSQYILLHYGRTGSLAPGCDAKDLIAWYKENAQEEYMAKGGRL